MAFRWGGLWGLGSTWGIDSPYCDDADDRVLVQMDDDTSNRTFRDFVCSIVEDLEEDADVAYAVKTAFDLDTAVGEQMDFIGSVIGLPRQGFDDTRYRTFLNIQVDLLLTASRDAAEWTGTHNNLLKICRTFIGTGVLSPVVLINTPPYAYSLTVPGVSLAELEILVTFICKATYGGVLGQVSIIVAPDSLWNSASVGPFADGGVWNSASVAVAPSMIWNFTVPIGTQPCE